MVKNMNVESLLSSKFLIISNRFILFLILCILFVSSPCAAHKVHVFAHVEGDNLVVDGYFSGSVKAKGCLVQVYDTSGARLLSGKTDSNGVCVFGLKQFSPDTKGVRIELEAEMGHKGDYFIDLSQDVATSTTVHVNQTAAAQNEADVNKPIPDGGLGGQLSQDDITRSVGEIIEKKLEPLVKILARLERLEAERKMDSSPKMTDIVGGIGWIVGLAGVAAFLLAKKSRS